MPPEIEECEPKKMRGSARSTFRADYRNRHGRISYREAADYAGVSVRTIEGWVYRKKDPLPKCAMRGAFIIDLLELEKFLRRGLK